MPVFISYYRPDDLKARRIYLQLTEQEVPAYLDELDPELQGAENVTETIIKRLASCTHLLAVISTETVRSWWVPFEIGVATRADDRIASYNTTGEARSSLPDYLRVWPVLVTSSDLDAFARRYKQDRLPLERSMRLAEAQRAAIRSSSEFHRALKLDIGQQ